MHQVCNKLVSVIAVEHRSPALLISVSAFPSDLSIYPSSPSLPCVQHKNAKGGHSHWAYRAILTGIKMKPRDYDVVFIHDQGMALRDYQGCSLEE